MTVREYSLPAGWYPRSPADVGDFLSNCDLPQQQAGGIAAIAPHAGWFYSGRTAAKAAAVLDRSAETVLVIGGHLPAGMPPLFAQEDAVRTPLGLMPIDAELRAVLVSKIGGMDDCYRDNTVEVLLPMVRYFFPSASLLWLRLPAEPASFDAGTAIAAAAAELGRRVVTLASTDLTHYGKNYNFSPKGGGPDALHWVREVNDANFIHAVESGSPAAVLECAMRDNSCCSAGAVLGALGFASGLCGGGAVPAQLLEYATSADALERQDCLQSAGCPDSFVGYAAFGFFRG